MWVKLQRWSHTKKDMKKKSLLACYVCCAVACLADPATAQEGSAPASTTQPATQPSTRVEYTTPEGVRVIVADPGNATVQNGDHVWVEYVLRRFDPIKTDMPMLEGGPVELDIGKGMVVKGWELGLLGMAVGERRRLVIPPELGFGAKGRPPKIKPDETLVFDVYLRGIRRKSFGGPIPAP